jgi:hypothetical protein
MTTTPPVHLRLVRSGREELPGAPVPAAGDLALLATLLAVNLVPIVGEVATRGGWGAGTAGLATAGALVTGRELWREVRALARVRRGR